MKYEPKNSKESKVCLEFHINQLVSKIPILDINLVSFEIKAFIYKSTERKQQKYAGERKQTPNNNLMIQ